MKKADGRLKRFLLASLVSPEMLFVRDVATQVVFMDSGSKAPQRSSSKARGVLDASPPFSAASTAAFAD
jgi:hypothetical protein